MKVIFLAHEPSLSGANIVLIENLKFLKKKGVDCKVLFPRLGPAVTLLQSLQIDIEIVSIRWWVFHHYNWKKLYPIRHFVRIFLCSWDISKILRKYKPDIFLSNTLTSPVGALAAKISKVPHVWHIHEFGWEDQRFKFLLGERISFWLINFLSKKVFLVSHALKEKFRFSNELKIEVIYNGLRKMNLCNPKVYSNDLKKESLNILSIGRFEPGKNFEDLIVACAELKRKRLNTEIKFTILGAFIQKEYVDLLQALAKDLEVSEYIGFIDHVPNPSFYYLEADLFVIPSEKEAFGLVTIEAMNHGLPVIGSNSGANPELIYPDKNGFLYKVKDGIDLAEKILMLTKSTSKLKEFGENSFKISLSFDPLKKGDDLYKELKALAI